MAFRGKGASAEAANFKCYDGKFGIWLSSGDRIHAVQAYKHLGGYLHRSGSNHMFVTHRAGAATGSYVPISGRVFGSTLIDSFTKMLLFRSLVCSSLCYLAHVKQIKTRELAKLNRVYMRVVRKSHDCSQHDATAESDLAVRSKFRVESIDCFITKQRLKYFSRIIGSQNHALIVLFSLRFEHAEELLKQIGFHGRSHAHIRHRTGLILPWMQVLLADFKCLLEHVSIDLPAPSSDSLHVWVERVEAWEPHISKIFFVQSRCDKGEVVLRMPCSEHACPECGMQFACSKALLQHRRVIHGFRTSARMFAGADSVCQCCQTMFSNRPRLIAHLTDSRRTRCIEWCELHGVKLSSATVKGLDEFDRELRKAARKQGHTAVQSTGQAVRADGRRLGHLKVG